MLKIVKRKQKYFTKTNYKKHTDPILLIQNVFHFTVTWLIWQSATNVLSKQILYSMEKMFLL